LSENHRSISGVIVAGGRGSRLGGREKGLLELAGRPMIAYVIAALQPQVGELLLNANREPERYRRFGLRIIPDTSPDYQGPLAGIAVALEQAANDWVLVVPCDAPLLPGDLAVRLRTELERAGAEICVPHDGERLQPLFLLLRRTLLSSIRDFLAGGDRKLLLWLESRNPAIADFSDQPGSFFNVNTEEERRQAEQRLR
jgi:molybdenum cofactor guanylyltransferase